MVDRIKKKVASIQNARRRRRLNRTCPRYEVWAFGSFTAYGVEASRLWEESDDLAKVTLEQRIEGFAQPELLDGVILVKTQEKERFESHILIYQGPPREYEVVAGYGSLKGADKIPTYGV